MFIQWQWMLISLNVVLIVGDAIEKCVVNNNQSTAYCLISGCNSKFDFCSNSNGLLSLVIQRTNFDFISNSTLSSLQSLKHLELLDNQMNGSQHLSNFVNILSLKFREPELNLISKIPKNFKNLNFLYLEFKSIAELVINDLPENLNNIVINNTVIGDNYSLRIVRNYVNLRDLTITHALLRTITIGITINKLLNLDLSHNQLQADKFHLSNLKYLTTLNLNYNDINILINSDFHTLKFLQTLYLRNNKIKFMDREVFNKNSKLEYVDLTNNYLKKIYTVFLANKFKVEITNNPLDCEFFRKFNNDNNFVYEKSFKKFNINGYQCTDYVVRNTWEVVIYCTIIFISNVIVLIIIKISCNICNRNVDKLHKLKSNIELTHEVPISQLSNDSQRVNIQFQMTSDTQIYSIPYDPATISLDHYPNGIDTEPVYANVPRQ